ncbi:hypothetical protein PoB_004676600 [Plakobranchus ocellatus]|uniref:Histone-lysine N-methyltransferase n=1 Tax=Plakobranchus ocellatus TaxID=259542 RepID=A0AAV4BA92_9GAST|nr:hypothetical protein PoB_004676600 [Plakobranchus ocellatus]
MSEKTVSIVEISADDSSVQKVELTEPLLNFLTTSPISGPSDYRDLPGAQWNCQLEWRSYAEFPRRAGSATRPGGVPLTAEERIRRNAERKQKQQARRELLRQRKERQKIWQRERYRQRAMLAHQISPQKETERSSVGGKGSSSNVIISSPLPKNPNSQRWNLITQQANESGKSDEQGKSNLSEEEFEVSTTSALDGPETQVCRRLDFDGIDSSAALASSLALPKHYQDEGKSVEAGKSPADSTTDELCTPASSSVPLPEKSVADSSTGKRKASHRGHIDWLYDSSSNEEFDEYVPVKHSRTSGRTIRPVERRLEKAVVDASMKKGKRTVRKKNILPAEHKQRVDENSGLVTNNDEEGESVPVKVTVHVSPDSEETKTDKVTSSSLVAPASNKVTKVKLKKSKKARKESTSAPDPADVPHLVGADKSKKSPKSSELSAKKNKSQTPKAAKAGRSKDKKYLSEVMSSCNATENVNSVKRTVVSLSIAAPVDTSTIQAGVAPVEDCHQPYPHFLQEHRQETQHHQQPPPAHQAQPLQSRGLQVFQNMLENYGDNFLGVGQPFGIPGLSNIQPQALTSAPQFSSGTRSTDLFEHSPFHAHLPPSSSLSQTPGLIQVNLQTPSPVSKEHLSMHQSLHECTQSSSVISPQQHFQQNQAEQSQMQQNCFPSMGPQQQVRMQGFQNLSQQHVGVQGPVNPLQQPVRMQNLQNLSQQPVSGQGFENLPAQAIRMQGPVDSFQQPLGLHGLNPSPHPDKMQGAQNPSLQPVRMQGLNPSPQSNRLQSPQNPSQQPVRMQGPQQPVAIQRPMNSLQQSVTKQRLSDPLEQPVRMQGPQQPVAIQRPMNSLQQSVTRQSLSDPLQQPVRMQGPQQPVAIQRHMNSLQQSVTRQSLSDPLQQPVRMQGPQQPVAIQRPTNSLQQSVTRQSLSDPLQQPVRMQGPQNPSQQPVGIPKPMNSLQQSVTRPSLSDPLQQPVRMQRPQNPQQALRMQRSHDPLQKPVRMQGAQNQSRQLDTMQRFQNLSSLPVSLQGYQNASQFAMRIQNILNRFQQPSRMQGTSGHQHRSSNQDSGQPRPPTKRKQSQNQQRQGQQKRLCPTQGGPDSYALSLQASSETANKSHSLSHPSLQDPVQATTTQLVARGTFEDGEGALHHREMCDPHKQVLKASQNQRIARQQSFQTDETTNQQFGAEMHKDTSSQLLDKVCCSPRRQSLTNIGSFAMSQPSSIVSTNISVTAPRAQANNNLYLIKTMTFSATQPSQAEASSILVKPSTHQTQVVASSQTGLPSRGPLPSHLSLPPPLLGPMLVSHKQLPVSSVAESLQNSVFNLKPGGREAAINQVSSTQAQLNQSLPAGMSLPIRMGLRPPEKSSMPQKSSTSITSCSGALSAQPLTSVSSAPKRSPLAAAASSRQDMKPAQTSLLHALDLGLTKSRSVLGPGQAASIGAAQKEQQRFISNRLTTCPNVVSKPASTASERLPLPRKNALDFPLTNAQIKKELLSADEYTHPSMQHSKNLELPQKSIKQQKEQFLEAGQRQVSSMSSYPSEPMNKSISSWAYSSAQNKSQHSMVSLPKSTVSTSVNSSNPLHIRIKKEHHDSLRNSNDLTPSVSTPVSASSQSLSSTSSSVLSKMNTVVSAAPLNKVKQEYRRSLCRALLTVPSYTLDSVIKTKPSTVPISSTHPLVNQLPRSAEDLSPNTQVKQQLHEKILSTGMSAATLPTPVASSTPSIASSSNPTSPSSSLNTNCNIEHTVVPRLPHQVRIKQEQYLASCERTTVSTCKEVSQTVPPAVTSAVHTQPSGSNNALSGKPINRNDIQSLLKANASTARPELQNPVRVKQEQFSVTRDKTASSNYAVTETRSHTSNIAVPGTESLSPPGFSHTGSISSSRPPSEKTTGLVHGSSLSQQSKHSAVPHLAEIKQEYCLSAAGHKTSASGGALWQTATIPANSAMSAATTTDVSASKKMASGLFPANSDSQEKKRLSRYKPQLSPLLTSKLNRFLSGWDKTASPTMSTSTALISSHTVSASISDISFEGSRGVDATLDKTGRPCIVKENQEDGETTNNDLIPSPPVVQVYSSDAANRGQILVGSLNFSAAETFVQAPTSYPSQHSNPSSSAVAIKKEIHEALEDRQRHASLVTDVHHTAIAAVSTSTAVCKSSSSLQTSPALQPHSLYSHPANVRLSQNLIRPTQEKRGKHHEDAQPPTNPCLTTPGGAVKGSFVLSKQDSTAATSTPVNTAIHPKAVNPISATAVSLAPSALIQIKKEKCLRQTVAASPSLSTKAPASVVMASTNTSLPSVMVAEFSSSSVTVSTMPAFAVGSSGKSLNTTTVPSTKTIATARVPQMSHSPLFSKSGQEQSKSNYLEQIQSQTTTLKQSIEDPLESQFSDHVCDYAQPEMTLATNSSSSVPSPSSGDDYELGQGDRSLLTAWPDQQEAAPNSGLSSSSLHQVNTESIPQDALPACRGSTSPGRFHARQDLPLHIRIKIEHVMNDEEDQEDTQDNEESMLESCHPSPDSQQVSWRVKKFSVGPTLFDLPDKALQKRAVRKSSPKKHVSKQEQTASEEEIGPSAPDIQSEKDVSEKLHLLSEKDVPHKPSVAHCKDISTKSTAPSEKDIANAITPSATTLKVVTSSFRAASQKHFATTSGVTLQKDVTITSSASFHKGAFATSGVNSQKDVLSDSGIAGQSSVHNKPSCVSKKDIHCESQTAPGRDVSSKSSPLPASHAPTTNVSVQNYVHREPEAIPEDLSVKQTTVLDKGDSSNLITTLHKNPLSLKQVSADAHARLVKSNSCAPSKLVSSPPKHVATASPGHSPSSVNAPAAQPVRTTAYTVILKPLYVITAPACSAPAEVTKATSAVPTTSNSVPLQPLVACMANSTLPAGHAPGGKAGLIDNSKAREAGTSAVDLNSDYKGREINMDRAKPKECSTPAIRSSSNATSNNQSQFCISNSAIKPLDLSAGGQIVADANAKNDSSISADTVSAAMSTTSSACVNEGSGGGLKFQSDLPAAASAIASANAVGHEKTVESNCRPDRALTAVPVKTGEASEKTGNGPKQGSRPQTSGSLTVVAEASITPSNVGIAVVKTDVDASVTAADTVASNNSSSTDHVSVSPLAKSVETLVKSEYPTPETETAAATNQQHSDVPCTGYQVVVAQPVLLKTTATIKSDEESKTSNTDAALTSSPSFPNSQMAMAGATSCLSSPVLKSEIDSLVTSTTTRTGASTKENTVVPNNQMITTQPQTLAAPVVNLALVKSDADPVIANTSISTPASQASNAETATSLQYQVVVATAITTVTSSSYPCSVKTDLDLVASSSASAADTLTCSTGLVKEDTDSSAVSSITSLVEPQTGTGSSLAASVPQYQVVAQTAQPEATAGSLGGTTSALPVSTYSQEAVIPKYEVVVAPAAPLINTELIKTDSSGADQDKKAVPKSPATVAPPSSASDGIVLVKSEVKSSPHTSMEQRCGAAPPATTISHSNVTGTEISAGLAVLKHETVASSPSSTLSSVTPVLQASVIQAPKPVLPSGGALITDGTSRLGQTNVLTVLATKNPLIPSIVGVPATNPAESPSSLLRTPSFLATEQPTVSNSQDKMYSPPVLRAPHEQKQHQQPQQWQEEDPVFSWHTDDITSAPTDSVSGLTILAAAALHSTETREDSLAVTESSLTDILLPVNPNYTVTVSLPGTGAEPAEGTQDLSTGAATIEVKQEVDMEVNLRRELIDLSQDEDSPEAGFATSAEDAEQESGLEKHTSGLEDEKAPGEMVVVLDSDAVPAGKLEEANLALPEISSVQINVVAENHDQANNAVKEEPIPSMTAKMREEVIDLCGDDDDDDDDDVVITSNTTSDVQAQSEHETKSQREVTQTDKPEGLIQPSDNLMSNEVGKSFAKALTLNGSDTIDISDDEQDTNSAEGREQAVAGALVVDVDTAAGEIPKPAHPSDCGKINIQQGQSQVEHQQQSSSSAPDLLQAAPGLVNLSGETKQEADSFVYPNSTAVIEVDDDDDDVVEDDKANNTNFDQDNESRHQDENIINLDSPGNSTNPGAGNVETDEAKVDVTTAGVDVAFVVDDDDDDDDVIMVEALSQGPSLNTTAVTRSEDDHKINDNHAAPETATGSGVDVAGSHHQALYNRQNAEGTTLADDEETVSVASSDISWPCILTTPSKTNRQERRPSSIASSESSKAAGAQGHVGTSPSNLLASIFSPGSKSTDKHQVHSKSTPSKHGLLSTIPADSPTGQRLHDLATWDKEKVSAWLQEHKLDKICPNLLNLDGRGLQRMVLEHWRDPSFFFQRIKKVLGVSIFQAMVICKSMKDIADPGKDAEKEDGEDRD